MCAGRRGSPACHHAAGDVLCLFFSGLIGLVLEFSLWEFCACLRTVADARQSQSDVRCQVWGPGYVRAHASVQRLTVATGPFFPCCTFLWYSLKFESYGMPVTFRSMTVFLDFPITTTGEQQWLTRCIHASRPFVPDVAQGCLCYVLRPQLIQVT